MKFHQQFLACLLLLALAIKEGLSLDCYSCNSFMDEDCATVGPKTKAVTCANNETVCRKVEQHINYQKQDHIRIFRQCGTQGAAGSCDQRTGTYKFKSWYCHCDGDLCNGSTRLMVPLALMVAVMAAVLGSRTFL